MNGLTSKCDRLKSENTKLQDKLTNMESQSRRNNLIVDGIPDSPDETKEQCKTKLLDFLDNTMKVENVREFLFVRVHRLGKYKPSAVKPRPVIMKLHYFDKREDIWSCRRNLKDSGFWIREDFPDVILQKRRVLEPVVKAARAQGKRAFLSVDKLILDDVTYTTDTLYHLSRDLQPTYLSFPWRRRAM